MRITVLGPQRPKPKAGDRRTTKRHGLQIRVHDMATDGRGSAIGRLYNNGRPMFSWVAPADLETWDRYHLTATERADLFQGVRV